MKKIKIWTDTRYIDNFLKDIHMKKYGYLYFQTCPLGSTRDNQRHIIAEVNNNFPIDHYVKHMTKLEHIFTGKKLDEIKL